MIIFTCLMCVSTSLQLLRQVLRTAKVCSCSCVSCFSSINKDYINKSSDNTISQLHVEVFHQQLVNEWKTCPFRQVLNTKGLFPSLLSVAESLMNAVFK